VISITDGQIYLETDLFIKACDLPCRGSFSQPRRFGGADQGMKQVAGRIKGDLRNIASWRPSRSLART